MLIDFYYSSLLYVKIVFYNLPAHDRMCRLLEKRCFYFILNSATL